jgi:hypothetical protein
MTPQAETSQETVQAATPARRAGLAPPLLAVIVPTLNERDNIAPLLARRRARRHRLGGGVRRR